MGSGAIARGQCANRGWRYLRGVLSTSLCPRETAIRGQDGSSKIAARRFEIRAANQCQRPPGPMARPDWVTHRLWLFGERTRLACWFRRLAETNFHSTTIVIDTL